MDFFINVILRKRTSAMVVKKTDDEITRIVKQANIIKSRREFEKKFQQDLNEKD